MDITYSKIKQIDPTLPAPGIPVLEQSNKGGLGVEELRKEPPVPVRVTALKDPGVVVDSTLTLYWDGQVVDQYTINQDQYDTGLVSFDVMPAEILDGENIEVFYQCVTPEGINPTISSPYFVRVNTKVPGDPPLNSPAPINEKLQLPRNIPDTITDDDVASGINVTIPNWTNMEVGDVLTLTWGQTRIPFGRPLEQADLDHPLAILVDGATILANGNTLDLRVFYDIRDNVNNWSLNSLPFITDVVAGPDTMPAPTVTQADANGVIELSELGTRNVQVVIPVYSPWTNTDHVIIRWRGLTNAGTAVDESVEFDMTENRPVTKEIKNATVTAIAGGTAVVFYEVNGLRQSKSKSLTVNGEIPALLPPQVLEQVNGVLDPATVPNQGATVVIAQYTGMNYGDHIYLYWEGTTQDGASTYYAADTPVETIGLTRFSVPKAANVAPLAGGSVKIYYTVVSGPSNRTSDPLELYVKAGVAVGIEIIQVLDSEGISIPNGGSTTSANVTIKGTSVGV